MMEIIHYCPANIATGGTESIHKLLHEFNKIEGVHAQILYCGKDLEAPQPEEYKPYGVEYITEFPEDFRGVVIFPEIWANRVVEPLYSKCITGVNWAGVDVYYWHNSTHKSLFLNNPQTIHLTQLKYAEEHLRGLGVKNILRISDVLNDDFFKPYEEKNRDNTILYNPCQAKMTQFTNLVKQRCITEYGLKFLPLQGYTRSELIEEMKKHKLYIDFGVFSGRERLPREAAMCGCCVITSKSGAAGNSEDVGIPDFYKFNIDEIDNVITTIRYALKNYDVCRPDFDGYRDSIVKDRENLPEQCKIVCERFKECQDSV